MSSHRTSYSHRPMEWRAKTTSHSLNQRSGNNRAHNESYGLPNQNEDNRERQRSPRVDLVRNQLAHNPLNRGEDSSSSKTQTNEQNRGILYKTINKGTLRWPLEK
ncbi:unnamed protein product [Eruca vesicaria subsp. sativa]|uniref:Uncharacterized protein n=1 Tax=Eruca vesicaria subsp. sativa TaxID=29727 RepID=A0ABC8K0D0_ERUVS|nr:unnamed protein product [Eruca vesicaria subsp. sativa]